MAKEKKNKKDESLIKEAIRCAKVSMKKAGVTDKAKRQLAWYSVAYIMAVVAVDLLISFGLSKFFGLVVATPLFWPFVLVLLLVWAGVTFLYYGYHIVEPNQIFFIRVMGGLYKPVSQGRVNFFPPIQDIHPQYISLQRQEVDVEEELELREVTEKSVEVENDDAILGRKIVLHERTTITAKIQVEYQIFDPYLFVFVMGGNTREQKEKIISGLIQDPLQTFANDRGYGEDELVALSGYQTWTGNEKKDARGLKDYEAIASGKKLEEAVEEYGFRILRVTIYGTELDEVRKTARTKVYQGKMSGQARSVEVEETVKGVFSTTLGEMSDEQLKEVRAYYIAIQVTESMGEGTKYVIGASAIIDEVTAMLGRKF